MAAVARHARSPADTTPCSRRLLGNAVLIKISCSLLLTGMPYSMEQHKIKDKALRKVNEHHQVHTASHTLTPTMLCRVWLHKMNPKCLLSEGKSISSADHQSLTQLVLLSTYTLLSQKPDSCCQEKPTTRRRLRIDNCQCITYVRLPCMVHAVIAMPQLSAVQC
jgi:hypothetical protein